ncbi:ACP S-malonyltransferase [Pleurocapsales cyanobacterium LEGE 10410]|nr:ACP S-malonyltransferase [Pleurocapsales cyanobacterium LEGE 10410]
MMKTAWVFPGQGSQSLGMGADLVDVPTAKIRFQQAQEILGWDLAQICLNEESKLSQTLYTQPCLYVISTILADLMREAGLEPSVVAGHSLGEYAALYTAGVIGFEAGLSLVKRRAELMATAPPGVMVALVGFNRDRLEAEIAQISGAVIANDNHNAQIVISGTPEGVNTVLEKVKIRRSVPLKVSGAFHSPLMADVSVEFNQVLSATKFQSAKVPVLSNVEPLPTTDAQTLKDRLMQQMTGQVRWREIVARLVQEGVEEAIEIGPGMVLTNTIFKMYPALELKNVGSNVEIAALQTTVDQAVVS